MAYQEKTADGETSYFSKFVDRSKVEEPGSQVTAKTSALQPGRCFELSPMHWHEAVSRRWPGVRVNKTSSAPER